MAFTVSRLCTHCGLKGAWVIMMDGIMVRSLREARNLRFHPRPLESEFAF